MLARAADGLAPGHDLLPHVQRVFETIGFAKVSTSGPHARALEFLRDGDRISMNRDRLLADAKALALLLARDFAPAQPNLRGLAWWRETVPVVVPHLSAEQGALMEDELAYQQHLAASSAYATLPRAAIHGDLFRDNVMFVERTLAGVFDFYFAGVDTLLFDIAVGLNDWCIDLASGRLDEDRASAFVAAYESERPLETAEVRLMPALMRAAAFRFWLSRAWDQHLPRDAVVLTAHDPDHFERVLVQRRDVPWHPAHAARGSS